MKSVFGLYSNSILAYLQEELEEIRKYERESGGTGDSEEVAEFLEVIDNVKAMTTLNELIEFEMEYEDSTAEDALEALISFIEEVEEEAEKEFAQKIENLYNR
ncbi:MAG: hypothetical protein AMJ88_13690 [Anaerolineae bacterium SM23_ 63]|nr:MAG: hypothetical protein AMJ88_13690 [Anaerolineae bacterium SM23_ 63]